MIETTVKIQNWVIHLSTDNDPISVDIGNEQMFEYFVELKVNDKGTQFYFYDKQAHQWDNPSKLLECFFEWLKGCSAGVLTLEAFLERFSEHIAPIYGETTEQARNRMAFLHFSYITCFNSFCRLFSFPNVSLKANKELLHGFLAEVQELL